MGRSSRSTSVRTGTRFSSTRRGASSRSSSSSSASARASAWKAVASPWPGGRRSAFRPAGLRRPSSPESRSSRWSARSVGATLSRRLRRRLAEAMAPRPQGRAAAVPSQPALRVRLPRHRGTSRPARGRAAQGDGPHGGPADDSRSRSGRFGGREAEGDQFHHRPQRAWRCRAVSVWQSWRQVFRSQRRIRVYEGTRLEDIARLETLAEAWGRVRSNKGGPGVDGVSIADLAPAIEASLEALSAALLAETYRPHKLRRAFIRKPDGGRRPLSIPVVIDRLAQTAAMLALEPEMDARMSETSLAYRVGRGPPQAIAAVERAFAEKLVWTLDADIERYYDRIWHRQLMTDLAIWIDDERILRLL